MKHHALGIVIAMGIGIFSSPFGTDAISRPDKEFSIFQFPQHQIPRIDGTFEDWADVPPSYSIGLNELKETVRGLGSNLDPVDFDITVKVGWVNGLNRLYFFVEATDDFWDFDRLNIQQDIFELVVDGNLSGGPFIKQQNLNKNLLPRNELHFKGHGAHAQNYHIFIPAENKDWAMVWGNTPWIKNFPQANAAYDYAFKHGESGTLRMEFHLTPFDHADPRGPAYSTRSNLVENELIGLSWCILDYDNHEQKAHAFSNLAHDTRMINDASFLCAFRLMPLEPAFCPALQANWSFTPLSEDQRDVAFRDKSIGEVTTWRWDFGDGTESTEQHPRHRYTKAGEWDVVLYIEGPDGKSHRAKVWDVVTK